MPKRKISVKTGLTADVLNLKGVSIGKITLPGEIFGVDANKSLIAQAVRVFQNNQRAGTHDTKTRGEVTGSTRKIYRQKGTGRARHGSIKAPIFIGGGIAHGPHPKDYSQTMPKQMKRLALFGALSDKYKNGQIKIVRGFEKIEAKTKNMSDAMTNLKLNPGKHYKPNTFLVISQKADNIWRSGRNIPYLTIGEAKLLNAYTVLSYKNIIVAEEAVGVLSDHFSDKKVSTKKELKKVAKKEVEKVSPKKEVKKIAEKVKAKRKTV